MSNFEFISHRTEVDAKTDRVIEAILTKWGQVAQGFATTNSPVDTGRLKNSITYEINVGDSETVIGTNVEYAPYVEFDDSKRHPVGKAHFMRDCVAQHVGLYEQIAKSYFRQFMG